MKSYFKLLAIAIVFIGFLSSKTYAQSPVSYKIEKVGAKYSTEILKEITEQGSLDSYRLNNAPRTLKFDDGSVVRLFSNSDSGKPSNNNVRYDGLTNYPNALFIGEDKTISEGIQQAYKIHR
jgi:hypothetical protein